MNVQVIVGRCIACGAEVESADPDGLNGLTCAKRHPSSPYEPIDAYYEDEAASWDDS